MKYEYSKNHSWSISAQIVGEEFEHIKNRYGKLKPEFIIESAIKKTSPIHSFFKWDDKKAAEQYRLQQASQLINSIRIVVKIKGKKISTPAFLNIKIDNDTNKFYEDINTVIRDPISKEYITEKARNQLKGWAEKYAFIDSFSEIIQSINQWIDEMETVVR